MKNFNMAFRSLFKKGLSNGIRYTRMNSDTDVFFTPDKERLFWPTLISLMSFRVLFWSVIRKRCSIVRDI